MHIKLLLSVFIKVSACLQILSERLHPLAFIARNIRHWFTKIWPDYTAVAYYLGDLFA